jgi:hypothetical protein
MRLPIILMLLTIALLPADLQGLAAQVQSGVDTARTTVTKFLDRSDEVKVAEASSELLPGSAVTRVR